VLVKNQVAQPTRKFVMSCVSRKHQLLLCSQWQKANLFSDIDIDSVLSGSVCYSSEDIKVLSEASLMLDKEEVHLYLFKSDQSSSESDDITDSCDLCEEQIGNTDWYYERSLCATSTQNRCTCSFCHSISIAQESNCCQELKGSIDWRSSSSLYHATY